MAINTQLSHKSEDTREYIAKSATRLFSQQGFDGTSIRDIADAAGVTKPVIYYYFENKEDMFVTLIREAYAFFFKKLSEITSNPGDFMERLRETTNLYFKSFNDYEDTVRLMYYVAFAPQSTIPNVDIMAFEKEHFELLTALFEAGINQGFIREGNIDQFIMHYLGSISVYMQTLMLDRNYVPDNFIDILLDHVLHGIGGNKE